MTDFSDEEVKVQMHIRIPRYLKRFLFEHAEKQGTDASNILRKYVRELYEEHRIRKESGDVEQL